MMVEPAETMADDNKSIPEAIATNHAEVKHLLHSVALGTGRSEATRRSPASSARTERLERCGSGVARVGVVLRAVRGRDRRRAASDRDGSKPRSASSARNAATVAAGIAVALRCAHQLASRVLASIAPMSCVQSPSAV